MPRCRRNMQDQCDAAGHRYEVLRPLRSPIMRWVRLGAFTATRALARQPARFHFDGFLRLRFDLENPPVQDRVKHLRNLAAALV